MKRILVFILALITVFALVGCDKEKQGDSLDGDVYTVRHAHIYPYASQLSYDNYDYSVEIDGAKAEMLDIFCDAGENSDGAYTEKQIMRFAGTVKLEDGYYVITVNKVYNSVKIDGTGANTYKKEMISSAKEQMKLLTPEDQNYKEYKKQYEMMIDLYNGKEVDITSMAMSEFGGSIVYKVKINEKIGKITEIQAIADGVLMEGYTFGYNEDGAIISSTEYDNDGDVWAAEYRANGTPSSFKYTTDNEILNFVCDENGVITKVTED